MSAHARLLVGIGAELRGDDAVGLRVAETARPRVPPGVEVRVLAEDATTLVEWWAGAELVVLVDAMRSAQPPGGVTRLDLLEPGHGAVAVGAGVLRSSHAFGVAEALALGRALGRLPARLIAYGIEGADFGVGAPMTPAVTAAVDKVVGRVVEEFGD
jgi:hydrogenase maturation protease